LEYSPQPKRRFTGNFHIYRTCLVQVAYLQKAENNMKVRVFDFRPPADHLKILMNYLKSVVKDCNLVASGNEDEISNDILKVISILGEYVQMKPNESDLESVLMSLSSLIPSVLEAEESSKIVDELCKKFTDPVFRDREQIIFRAITNLFHAMEDVHPVSYRHQYKLFMGMLNLSCHCKPSDIPLRIISLEQAGQWLNKWECNLQERRDCFRLLHRTLLNSEQIEAPAKVMYELLSSYTTEADAYIAGDDARECVRSAINDPRTFIFSHLFSLLPVQQLADEPIYRLLTIFDSGSLDDYIMFYEQNKQFVDETMGLSNEQYLYKMRVLTFMSIAEKRKQISLSELMNLLKMENEHILEEFVIKAIQSKMVYAQIDDAKKMVLLHGAQSRPFGRKQWEEVLIGLKKWEEGIRYAETYFDIQSHSRLCGWFVVEFAVLAYRVVMVANFARTLVTLCIVLHVSSARPCVEDESFYFNVQPKGITVREGSRAFLECNVSSDCNMQFHWVLNDEIVVNNTRRYQNGSNLVITRVNRSLDYGEFFCIATIATTGLAKQRLKENVSVTALSSAEMRGELQLRCDAEGYDEPLFRWYHNGHRLRRSERVTWRGRRLTVHAVTVHDNGVYSCEAENSAGIVRSFEDYVLSLPGAVPKIVTIPQNIIAPVGWSALFDCAYDGAEKLYWKAGNYPDLLIGTDPSQRIYQLANNSLLITSVLASDEGNYECIGEADIKSSLPKKQSYSAHLAMPTLGLFRGTNFEPVRDIYVVGQGKRFEIACVPPSGRPMPKIHWTRNGQRVPDVGRVRSSDDYSLVIDSARLSDRGEYDCVAENMAGVQKGKIYVHVSKLPVIERHPSSLEVEEGSEARLDCSYRGNEYPVTVVDWEKDQSVISPVRPLLATVRRKQFPDNGTLLIYSVSMADSGEYTCVVKTLEQHPVYSQPAIVRVLERLKFSPRPVDRKLELNSDVQIPCRAVGHAPTKVKWLRLSSLSTDGTEIQYQQPLTNLSPHIRDKDGVLYFHNAQFEDAGYYMCVAVSSQGVINVTIKIEVIVAPIFDLVPNNVTVEEEQNVWLHCAVRGTPSPTVRWYFEGSPDSEWTFAHHKYSNNTLLLIKPTVEQAGKYNCMAVKLSNISHCGRHVGLQRSFSDIDSAELMKNERDGMTLATTGIACGAAAGYILLVVFLVSYCGYRRRRGRLIKAHQGQSSTPLQVQIVEQHLAGKGAAICSSLTTSAQSGGELLLKAGGNYSSNGSTTSQPVRATLSSSKRARFISTFKHLQFPRENLRYRSTLGSGVYGEVYLMLKTANQQQQEQEQPNDVVFDNATTTTATTTNTTTTTTVVVKSLLTKEDWAQGEFMQELELYARCDHPNVAKLLGVCASAEPILVIFDYLDYYKSSVSLLQASYPPPLTSSQIFSIVYQVAEAMQHISDRRFVHKDLAARNVLLSSKYFVKVTHLSLSNDQFLAEYYTYRNLVLPLRWMPDEALFDDDWSVKSDVWSFGVFIWELLTMGELPYQACSNDEVIECLKCRQLKLALPTGPIPSILRKLVADCMAVNPKDRPLFSEIRDRLAMLSLSSSSSSFAEQETELN
ncbi:Inactive tyrosine-protein kinase 7, partial [Trichinella zimbabwensis]